MKNMILAATLLTLLHFTVVDPLEYDSPESNKVSAQMCNLQCRSGTLFTVWGSSSCPGTTDTKIVYDGIAAKSSATKSGGGVDYQCLTKQPQYLTVKPGVQESRSFIAKVEYEDWDGKYSASGFRGRGVSCAVCLASSRSLTLMIPGRIQCPTGWTREYFGYLVAERTAHASQSNYVCLHKDLKAVRKTNVFGPTMMLVEAKCNGAKHCPPYVAEKELTCVVCTM